MSQRGDTKKYESEDDEMQELDVPETLDAPRAPRLVDDKSSMADILRDQTYLNRQMMGTNQGLLEQIAKLQHENKRLQDRIRRLEQQFGYAPESDYPPHISYAPAYDPYFENPSRGRGRYHPPGGTRGHYPSGRGGSQGRGRPRRVPTSPTLVSGDGAQYGPMPPRPYDGRGPMRSPRNDYPNNYD